VLPVVVNAVADTLRLPYAAITLGHHAQPAAVRGARPATTIEVPLLHAGRAVGTLTVGLPAGRSALDPPDDRLLHDFAEHVGAAAYGVLLNDDLRRFRDSLAGARDEERHRIHRDLHDGLGPTLAGVALGLGAARRAATAPAARELLTSLEAEVKHSLDDVKRLVADLHPTALEQAGLIPALHDYADTVTARSGGRLDVRVTAAEVPQLPPEVEVAAYRIGLEAVTNVARHAEATRCDVSLSMVGGALTITVDDDGIGIPAGQRPGLGLRSIAERAAELGGRAVAESGQHGGTVVRAELPLRRPS
jgi:signal transduction histidine kinase